MAFEQRSEGCEEGNKLCGCLEKSCPGRENNKCKGSETGVCLECLRNNKEVLGLEWSEGGRRVGDKIT